MRLLPALDAQLRRDAGISHFEYEVLAALSEAPERTLRMSDLAVLAEGSLSRLSQVVARLEKKKWVRRTPDPTDGRYTLAILTDDGWDKIVATAPGHVNEVRRLVIDPLTNTQLNQLTTSGNGSCARSTPPTAVSPTAPHSCATKDADLDRCPRRLAPVLLLPNRRKYVVGDLLASRLQMLLRSLYANGRHRWHSFYKRRIRRQRLHVPDKSSSRFSVFIASEVVLATSDPVGCDRVVAQHGVERIVDGR